MEILAQILSIVGMIGTILAFQIKITVDGLRDDHVIAWLINTASNLIKHYFREHKRFIMEIPQ